MPEDYVIDQAITADFDGDGSDEQVSIASPLRPPGANNVPKLLMVSHGNTVIWQYKEMNFNAIEQLQARELTGDGHPELLFATATYGASGGFMEYHALCYASGTFANLIGTPEGVLSHSLSGGLLIEDGEQPYPARLILYDAVWASQESRADAHRYRAEWYHLLDGKFVRVARMTTRHKYRDGNPLAEFNMTVERTRE